MPVFAVALTVKLPLLAPLVGEAVIQVWLSVTVQLTLAVTATGNDEAADANDSVVGDTVRLLVGVPNTVASTEVARMPLVPFTIRLPQVVSVRGIEVVRHVEAGAAAAIARPGPAEIAVTALLRLRDDGSESANWPLLIGPNSPTTSGRPMSSKACM